MTKRELLEKIKDDICLGEDENLCKWLDKHGFIKACPYTAYVYYLSGDGIYDHGDFLGTSENIDEVIDAVLDEVSLEELEREFDETEDIIY